MTAGMRPLFCHPRAWLPPEGSRNSRFLARQTKQTRGNDRNEPSLRTFDFMHGLVTQTGGGVRRMLRLSGVWGMMATGLVLVWGSVAAAQSPASPNECRTTGAAPQPA